MDFAKHSSNFLMWLVTVLIHDFKYTLFDLNAFPSAVVSRCLPERRAKRVRACFVGSEARL